MLKRLLIFGLGTSLVQIILFYLFIFIVHLFPALLTYNPSNDPSGDYVVLMGAIIFPLMVLAQTLIAALINNRKVTYVLIFGAFAVYLFGLIDIGTSVPFKSGLCLAFGCIVLGLKTQIDGRLRKPPTIWTKQNGTEES